MLLSATRLAVVGVTISGLALWATGIGDARPNNTALAAAPVAFAHLVLVNAVPHLDSSASYGITGILDVKDLTVGSGDEVRKISGVCLYGNFTPAAVSGTSDAFVGPPPVFGVSILASWLPAVCSQNPSHPVTTHPILGHVVAFLEIQLGNNLTLPQVCAADSPQRPGPSLCAKGVWLVFY